MLGRGRAGFDPGPNNVTDRIFIRESVALVVSGTTFAADPARAVEFATLVALPGRPDLRGLPDLRGASGSAEPPASPGRECRQAS